METIQTSRLKLIALTKAQLEKYINSHSQLEVELGFKIAYDNNDEPVKNAINIKIKKMAEVAEHRHPWLTYWLIFVEEVAVGVGLIGFKGLPDLDGKTEVGYGIDPAYQNLGYTTEALQGLMAWAFHQPECKTITAETLMSNVASARVLEKSGFKMTRTEDNSIYWGVECPGNK